MNYENLWFQLRIGVVNTNVIKAIEDMRNELCLKCGKYKTSHLGTCKGCRWEK